MRSKLRNDWLRQFFAMFDSILSFRPKGYNSEHQHLAASYNLGNVD